MKPLKFLIALALLLLVQATASASANVVGCGLCISEVQTQGLGGATEEYIVLTNNTSVDYNMSGHVVRYITAGGTPNSKTIALSGILAPYENVTFISDSLKLANPNVGQFPAGLALADVGGSVQLLKNSQPIDQLGWGTASELFREGPAASTHQRGWSIVRKQNSDGTLQDTGNNSGDFMSIAHACQTVSLNEIQPFLIDPDGQDLTQSIELLKTTATAEVEDCPISINGSVFNIAANDIGPSAGLAVIDGFLDDSNQTTPLNLHSNEANNFQFMPQNAMGGIVLPGAFFTQPVLLNGQTYAKFSTGFKATYYPTIGAANQLRTTPLVPIDVARPEQSECSGTVLSELLPNPTGEDSDAEWAEFANTTNQVTSLKGCVLEVNGTQYLFSPDQFIGQGEFLVLSSFSDGASTRTLSLKNSGLNTVSLGHLSGNGSFEPLQTIQYLDALEGQSWARFDDGWRWAVPTPAVENMITHEDFNTGLVPTELPAPTASTASGNSASALTTVNITELLPNPAAPATDDTDEFVELYNPTDQPIDLTNYKVQSGNNYTYSYTLGARILLGHQYATLFSRDSGLVLANTSGHVRLLDPAGNVVSETDQYDTAIEGSAWAFISGTWQWTISPTPGNPNIASIPLLAAAPKTKSVKAPAAKAKPKTSKTASPKTTAVKSAKTATTKDRQIYEDPAAASATIHTDILVGVGAITLLYAGYEYRHDAVNAVRRFRRYREVRRTARPQPSGR
ncbi:MAG TPA: lamin tail domain-containing protein [Candidatus Limnocylindrales bacterium]|nr:lamin tail domain-containing protein [Candidatus Limnocylindrales bacterium]